MATDTVCSELERFIRLSQAATNQTSKFLAFSEFVERTFAVKVEELIPGIELKIGSKILGVRGSIDLLFSLLVLEFKTSFDNELEDGKKELVKYFQALFEKEPKNRYVGVITDCIKYATFLPAFEKGVVTNVTQVGETEDITQMNCTEAILFLDSRLFSKKGIKPTAIDLSLRFGPGSPTHAVSSQNLVETWAVVEDEPDVKLKLKLWTSYMNIVYGKQPPKQAFLDQTYLVILVKLLIYLRLSGTTTPNPSEIEKALSGDYFKSFGISNLIEEDYFSWILNSKVRRNAIDLSTGLVKELLRYDISSVYEDLFKEIYQTVVRQGERHRTGEFYTPEWLAEITLRAALVARSDDKQPFPRILDPACGSGTFLTNSIAFLKSTLQKEGRPAKEALHIILENVMGFDMNPVAVVIARANYILALGDYLQTRANFSIPVYVTDAIRIPTVTRTYASAVDVYDIDAEGVHLQIPVRIASSQELLANLIDSFRASLDAYGVRKQKSEALDIMRKRMKDSATDEEFEIIKLTEEAILQLIDKGEDSIWLFVLSNIYAPIVLKGTKFDIIVGNPPWIVMRTIENQKYQDFLKKQVFEYNLLSKNEGKLYTHMEMATLFFCRTSDLYLKEGGIISFLMPISVTTGALQHRSFVKLAHPPQKMLKVLSFEEVPDIFSLPPVTLIARKGETTQYPVDMVSYKGKIDKHHRNEKLSVVGKNLIATTGTFTPPVAPLPQSYSHYYKQFKEGPTLVPRNLWFIDFDIHPTLGIDTNLPLVKTSEKVIEVGKEEWNDIRLKGNIESEYLYTTILGKDLIPFGYVMQRPIILPMEPLSNQFVLRSSKQLRSQGKTLIAEWIDKNQKIWEERRTPKSQTNYPLATDRLNHNSLLTSQDPSKRFVLIFNARGADAMAHVIDRRNLPRFILGQSNLNPREFTADTTDFYFETNNLTEAHYLCAFLNSSVLNKAVKPFQPKGKYGYRDIGRRPLMFSIPMFDSQNEHHTNLAQLSLDCHAKISAHAFKKPGSFKAMRNEALIILKQELNNIDDLVMNLIDVTI